MGLMNHVSLPNAFDPSVECFSIDFYKHTDNRFRICHDSIRSDDPEAKQRSMRATNFIVYVVVKLVLRALRENLGSPDLVALGVNDGADEKVRKIIPQLFSGYFRKLGVELDKQQVEWTKRACNVLRSYYRNEIGYMKKFLEMPKILTTRDRVYSSTVTWFYSLKPGSLADMIGREARQQFEEIFPTE